MALQLQQQGTSDGVDSLALLDGSHSYTATIIDRTSQRWKVSADTASMETAIIRSFIVQYAFRLAHTDGVCLTVLWSCCVTEITYR